MQNKFIKHIVVTGLFLLTCFNGWSQCGSGQNTTTSISNVSCSTAAILTPGAPCVTNTTCDGNASISNGCIGTGYDCAWYKFTATASSMYVSVSHVNNSGCCASSQVFSGGCLSLNSISCITGCPLDDVHSLTGLQINATYFIRICYPLGGPCGNNGFFEYCVEVGEPDPPCDQCSTPCGTAAGYSASPAVQQVVDDCQTSPFVPALQASSTNTFCYSFAATASSVNFNVIITSNCGGGNVSAFSWQLYDIPSCGSPIQTGTLASLTFSPVTIGNDYVFCYTFTVPSTCTHSQHCPYFVGAVPLPIELLNFSAKVIDDDVILNWQTGSEVNNNYFTVERTQDGISFEELGVVEGANNSSISISYEMIDLNPFKGLSYYRLKQTDYDGNSVYSNLVAVEVHGKLNDIQVLPNPVDGLGMLTYNSEIDGDADLVIRDIFGNEVLRSNLTIEKGENTFPLEGSLFEGGMYFITLSYLNEINTIRFIKK